LREKEERGRSHSFKVNKLVKKIELGIAAMVIIGAVQAGMRTCLGLGAAGVLGMAMKDTVMGMIESPIGNEMLFIAVPFLLLGIMGAVAVVGLVLRRPWGYYSTMMVSVMTIAYDLWAAVSIQSSALIGMIVPVVMLTYLMLRKERYLTSWAVSI
jgi:hypothetical protein